MGHMSKKHRRRVDHLEIELGRLEEITKPTLSQQHRIQRIKGVELPKAKRFAARA